jgi:hypothetical protein
MHGYVAESLNHFRTIFSRSCRRPPSPRQLRFRVGVDIAELAAEADIEPANTSPKAALGIPADALLHMAFHGAGNQRAAVIRIEDPAARYGVFLLPRRTGELVACWFEAGRPLLGIVVCVARDT